MTDPDLSRALAEAWRGEREHVERVVLAAAVITTALERGGMRATLVGGAAVEFYAPEAYATTDLDFVVEGRPREAIDRTLVSIGLQRRGRHWVLEDLFVEVPALWLSDEAVTFPVGPFTLRVIRLEHILAERIVGFRWWKYAAYAVQSVDLILAARSLDDALIRSLLRKEGAEDTYDLLRAFTESGRAANPQDFQTLWEEHYGTKR